MNFSQLPKNILRARYAATLLSTASLMAFGSSAMAAEANAGAGAEEVLITGSLIRGAPAVGVPVTALGEEEFREQAAVTVSDLFRKVPAITVIASTAHGANGSNLTKAQRVAIHGQGGSRTLVLIDGMRFPLTGVYADGYDPSIIPSIALQRLDVLADGASATYGSDAIAGVVNLILRRGYDGAQSQALYQYVQDGAGKWQVSQLFGRVWDGGGVTVSFDYYDEEALKSADRPFATWDFTPWGLDNRIPLRSSIPATVSFGTTGANSNAQLPSSTTNPIGFSGSGCTNCLLVPSGQNGVGLTWATLLGRPMIPQTASADGTNNLVDPHRYAEFTGVQQRAATTLTFDQRVMPGVSFFFDAFYSNRRNNLHNSPAVNPWTGGTFQNFVVPTVNPYLPTGVPAGVIVKVSYSTALELDIQFKAKESSGRYVGGFNFDDLPFDWNGRVFYSVNDEKNQAIIVPTANQNNILAALGNVVFDPDGANLPFTVGPTPRSITAADLAGQSARIQQLYPVGSSLRVISPTAVPFLNPFCDPQAFKCNDQRTLDFISAHWLDRAFYQIHQVGANFDGPLFELPGGTVRGAVGGAYVSDSWQARAERDQSLFSSELERPIDESLYRNVWSAFGQVNIPIIGEANAFLLAQRIDIEVSGRYDHYSDFGSTWNPKVGANWTVFGGLTLRGSWGTSFAAPAFQYMSVLAGKNISATNVSAGGATNNTTVCTQAQISGAGQPTAGSAAAAILGIVGAANCSDAAITSALAALTSSNPYFGYNLTQVRFAGQIAQNGGSSAAYGIVRPPGALGPEEAENYSLGFEFAPEGLLRGLNVHASYYHIQIDNFLGGFGASQDPFNDPEERKVLSIRGDDANNPGGSFATALTSYLNSPALASGISINAATIAILRDSMTFNLYQQESAGIDFGARYDWDMGELGAWGVGVTGFYALCDKQQSSKSAPVTDSCHTATNSWGVAGNTTNSRLRMRGEISWDDPASGWSAALFTNYRSHYFSTEARPATATVANLLGVPVASLTGQAFADAMQSTALFPAQYTFDVSVGYDLAEKPANPYLHNLSFRLTINDIFDRIPPFQYRTASGGAGPAAFDPTQFSPLGRIIAFQVTKDW